MKKTLILRTLFYTEDKQIRENHYTMDYSGDHVPALNTFISNTFPSARDYRIGHTSLEDAANFVLVTTVMFEPDTDSVNCLCIIEKQRHLFTANSPETWLRALLSREQLEAMLAGSKWVLRETCDNPFLTKAAKPILDNIEEFLRADTEVVSVNLTSILKEAAAMVERMHEQDEPSNEEKIASYKLPSKGKKPRTVQ